MDVRRPRATNAADTAASPGTRPDSTCDHLREYLDAHCPGYSDGPLAAEVIAGGKSNLTYQVSGASGSVVLRRPPLAHVLPTAHDMSREYTRDRGAAPDRLPGAGTTASVPDTDVIGAPFYLMSYVDGVVLRGAEDIAALSPATRPRDPASCSWTRWPRCTRRMPSRSGWATSAGPTATWNGRCGGGTSSGRPRRPGSWPRWRRSLRRCAKPCQPAGGPRIVHGDFRLDNCMYDADAQPDPGGARLGDGHARRSAGRPRPHGRLHRAGRPRTGADAAPIGPEQGFLTSAATDRPVRRSGAARRPGRPDRLVRSAGLLQARDHQRGHPRPVPARHDRRAWLRPDGTTGPGADRPSLGQSRHWPDHCVDRGIANSAMSW